MSYNERRGSLHADDSAINPAKEPLHYQLYVTSGWTLHTQNSFRYNYQLKHSDTHTRHKVQSVFMVQFAQITKKKSIFSQLLSAFQHPLKTLCQAQWIVQSVQRGRKLEQKYISHWINYYFSRFFVYFILNYQFLKWILGHQSYEYQICHLKMSIQASTISTDV